MASRHGEGASGGEKVTRIHFARRELVLTKIESHELDRRGVWLALSAAALFGISAPPAKALLQGASPQLLAGLLYAGSGVGLAIVAVVRSRRSQNAETPLTRNDAPWLGGAILFGGTVGPVLLLVGLAHAPASSASLLLNLEGVFIALIASVVFRENVDRRIAVGMLLIPIGGAVPSWEKRLSWGGASVRIPTGRRPERPSLEEPPIPRTECSVGATAAPPYPRLRTRRAIRCSRAKAGVERLQLQRTASHSNRRTEGSPSH